ncbi:MAG: VOC family protein, partial [Gammaproteobacteria bacterium]
MARVRYIVDNVEEAVAFYTSNLGFEIEQNFAPAIAILVHGDLTLLVSGPKASASKPMLDGTTPSPGGGWNRFL